MARACVNCGRYISGDMEKHYQQAHTFRGREAAAGRPIEATYNTFSSREEAIEHITRKKLADNRMGRNRPTYHIEVRGGKYRVVEKFH